MFAAADFDFRELGENWYKATQRAGVGNALLYALDAPAYEYFLSRRIAAVVNGTDNLDAWAGTRLQRHIQRALAERHMAAAALVGAGFDVLLTDTTHVVLRNPFGYLRAQRDDVDLWAMRGGCNAKRPEHSEAGLGCGMVWNFLFLRGARDAARGRASSPSCRTRSTRGWSTFTSGGGRATTASSWGTPRTSAAGRRGWRGGSPRARTRCAPMRPRSSRCCRSRAHRWCKEEPCMRIGMLPHDKFPPPGGFPDARTTAFVGRAARPDLDPKRSHRLRLDRYDERDFDNLVAAMKAQGLWLL